MIVLLYLMVRSPDGFLEGVKPRWFIVCEASMSWVVRSPDPEGVKWSETPKVKHDVYIVVVNNISARDMVCWPESFLLSA